MARSPTKTKDSLTHDVHQSKGKSENKNKTKNSVFRINYLYKSHAFLHARLRSFFADPGENQAAPESN